MPEQSGQSPVESGEKEEAGRRYRVSDTVVGFMVVFVVDMVCKG